MPRFTLSLHAHFYAPPRTQWRTGAIGTERSAAPFRNWNERLAQEVYRPNLEAGNFTRFSFDFGEDFALWLESHNPEAYQRLADSLAEHMAAHGVANLLAAPLFQSPLTLLSPRDRLTQLRWGAAVAERRFGLRPKGVFLPRFALNDLTLQSVVDVGFEYTLVCPGQVSGLTQRGGAGPYRLTLASGDTLKVFVVDEGLSKSLAHELRERGGAGFWARQNLVSHCRKAGPLTLLYVEGDQLGQNHMGEALFIRYLLAGEAQAAGYRVMTLESYYAEHPNTLGEVRLVATGREVESDTQRFFRDALHDLMIEANLLLEAVLGNEAWIARDTLFDTPQSPKGVLLSQIALQRAWANVAQLDEHPQISPAHIYEDVAFACRLLHQQTQTDLGPIFAERLPAPARREFEALYVNTSEAESARV
jgi:hypothetical protein